MYDSKRQTRFWMLGGIWLFEGNALCVIFLHARAFSIFSFFIKGNQVFFFFFWMLPARSAKAESQAFFAVINEAGAMAAATAAAWPISPACVFTFTEHAFAALYLMKLRN